MSETALDNAYEAAIQAASAIALARVSEGEDRLAAIRRARVWARVTDHRVELL